MPPPAVGLLGRFLSWLARRSWFAATVVAGGMPVEGRVKYLRHIDEVRFGPLADDDEGSDRG